MMVRESGMPEEGKWSTFFDAEQILLELGLSGSVGCAVDFGCGYGTFTIPAAQVISGSVHAFDLDPVMIQATRQKAESLGLTNAFYHLRDFAAEGSGLDSGTVDYVMLFNILHSEKPEELLLEANRILRFEGLLGVMHWNYDPATPRGPSMEIRPRPEQVRGWVREAGFSGVSGIIDLPPYHYGMVGRKGELE